MFRRVKKERVRELAMKYYRCNSDSKLYFSTKRVKIKENQVASQGDGSNTKIGGEEP